MKKLLIIEDDATYAAGLVRTLSRRGFMCLMAASNQEALKLCEKELPTHVLMDLNLGVEDTQQIISPMRKMLPKSVLVVLTGYGTIPSTVKAMKDGVDHYLCKPVQPDTLVRVLNEEHEPNSASSSTPLWDIESDHILNVLEECGGNITQAAKALGLHRRTLQRRLKKIDPN